MRLFVALPIPPELRARIARMRDDRMVRARWVRDEQLHLTLRFVGDWPTERLGRLERALSEVAAPVVTFSLGARGAFGRPPRVLFVSVVPRLPVVALMRAVDAAVRTAGAPPLERVPEPHVTVARLKNAPPFTVRRWCDGACDDRAEAPARAVTVDRFTLYESELSQTGPSYRALRSFALGSGDG